MKNPILLCLSALCAMSMFTACGNDEDPKVPGEALPEKTYTVANGLNITVDGEEAYGQAVTFTPGNGGSATITIAGQGLDLSSLIGGIMRSDNTPGMLLPTASVIPGSVQVTVPVVLEGDSDNVTFSGNYETEYCSFAYAGMMTADAMALDVKNVVLKNTTLAGTYDMNDFDDLYYNVCRMEWYSENNVQAELYPGTVIPLPMKAMLMFMLGGYELVEVDGEKMNVLNALNAVIKSVTLGNDGSVIAEYGDTGVAGLPVKTSAKGLAQYVVTSDNQMRLILNPYAIIAASAGDNSRAEGEGEIDPSVLLEKLLPVAENLLPKLIPLLSQGIPVSYGPALVQDEEDDSEMVPSDDPNFVSFYLDTNTLLPILKDIAPLLGDDDVVNFIVQAASQDPDMGFMAGMLPPILKSLPDVINTTSKIELGLNLQKR